MFPPARVVVVDDEPAHLDAIGKVITDLGSSAVCIPYKQDRDPPVLPLSRARVIFMDLQLRHHQAGSDFRQHYAEIQRLLTLTRTVHSGPFLLIVWTSRPGQVGELDRYLTANLRHTSPHALPVRVLELSKPDFIALDSGVARDPEALAQRVQEQLREVPGLAALLRWESDIVAASDRVMRDVLRHASSPPEADSADPIADALRRMACEAVGEPNVTHDPQGAVHSALLPLLEDQVQYETVMDPATPDVWRRALEGGAPPSALTRHQAADLNSHLHLGGRGDRLKPVNWGAICELEDGLQWSDELGIESEAAFRQHVLGRIKSGRGGADPTADQVHLAQIRIGASCDYAQKTDGPIPYVLAAFVPVLEHPPAQPGGRPKSSALGVRELEADSTCWLSPLLNLADWGVGHLLVDPRFVRVRGASAAGGFTAVDRLREQLLMHLIGAVARHGDRPGIVRFTGSDRAAAPRG